jgi:hypothetical protein
MSNFERLQGQVADGSMKLIHIEAVPRSVSTALSRAINEADGPSIYVNEPFNRMKHDIEAASGHILAVTDPIARTSDEPLTVVTKNMARNLSLPLFREWMGVCDGVAWSVRDPLVQMGSLLTRIANDLAYEPGADRITQNELTTAQIEAASAFLENGPVSKGFSKTSWADMGNHFRSGYQSEHSVVIDGGELTARPLDVLSGACDKLGLKFNPHMVEGWEGDFVNANTGYNPNLDDTTHAWTRHAATSVGIVAVSRAALEIAELPSALQDHLTQVAIPVYEEMMATNGGRLQL